MSKIPRLFDAAPAPLPDADRRSWVSGVPASVRPFLVLMRADRAAGTWLLLLPCWWGMALAMPGVSMSAIALAWYAVLFAVGAFVMRGAGCVYNDIIDQDLDAKVSRTAQRPLPSGQVSTRQAWFFLTGLCWAGLVVLLQFNTTTRVAGLCALPLVAVYPFMKRITWWPQVWLGLTFNWGVLLGWGAVTGTLGMPAIILLLAGLFWTLSYDTIYAHQDKEDDALVGIKSSARRLGEHTRFWVSVFFAGQIILTFFAAFLAAHHWVIVPLLLPACIQMCWQVVRLDISNPVVCLMLFKTNCWVGVLILGALCTSALITHFTENSTLLLH